MTKLILALVAALALAPLASGSDDYRGALVAGYPVAGTPTGVLVQNTDAYNVTLSPGDLVRASLSWVPAVNENDLDLVLLVPSAAPVPLATDPNNPDALAASATGFANTRLARQTCSDMAAKSVAHAGSSESLSFTVPAGGESGAYVLQVRGFVLEVDQSYRLSITVTRDGAPLAGATEKDNRPSAFITTAPYCQLA